MIQIKKNPLDPEYQDINPAIISLARRNGFVKEPIQLFLLGQLTWTEALETMIVTLGKEFTAQTEILVEEIEANTELRKAILDSSQLEWKKPSEEVLELLEHS